MNKILLVIRNEILTVVLRRSFFLTLFLIPLGGLVMILIVTSLQRGEEGSNNFIADIFNPHSAPTLEGYVDYSELIEILPESAAGRLRLYPDEAEAARALEFGKITAYYLIPSDYLESGKIVYVRPDFNPMAGMGEAKLIEEMLAFNLLKDDPILWQRLKAPMMVETIYLSDEPQRDAGNMLTFFLPYIVTMLCYIVIFGNASLMLNSITTEKENRVLEVLMSSMTPHQMLSGKIIALGVIGLFQTLFWGSAGLGLLRLSGQTFEISEAFQLPVTILVWAVLFFLAGYALYASLMAGIGALVPNLRESSQAVTIVIIPMIIPLMLIGALVQEPNGIVAVALSFFPLTAPVAMMTRLAATTTIPIWQPLLALALLAISAALLVRGVAGLFRAQNLLSGQSFKLGVFLKALAGRG